MNGSLTFIIFVALAIFVYSLLNYYFIRKHKNTISLSALSVIIVRLLLITIILTPIATIYFSWHGASVMTTLTSFTLYSWLAFLFLFLFIHGSVDIVLFGLGRFGFRPPAMTAKLIFLTTLGVSIFILFYGWYDARNIRVERISISTSKLPADVERMTFGLISDVHFSPIIGERMATEISRIIKKENVDILLCTGDLLDRGIAEPENIISILKSINPPLGKFAITGNHEFIAGIDDSVKFIEKSGFNLLRDEAYSIKGVLNIVGVDDPSLERFEGQSLKPEKWAFRGLNPELFTLLLKHQPWVEKENLDLFDLQISGHTHAGQIFPFTALVKLVFPYICGLYDLGNHTQLYVSRGTGTWGPPFRFLAPPEITIIELKGIH